MQEIEALAKACHEAAKDKGFWDSSRNHGELIALIHSELSEALEALRCSGPPKASDKLAGFLAVEEEMADAVIRILDMCAARRWRIGKAIEAKMAYNRTREYKHGKAF